MQSVPDWRQIIFTYFGILEKYVLTKSKGRIGQTWPKRVSFRCCRPMQIKVKNPFLDFLWKSDAVVELTPSPGCLCTYITWCEVSGSQQTFTTHSGLCLWKEAHPHNGNAEFVTCYSQLRFSVFLNLLIHNVQLRGCQCWVKPGFEAGNSRAESCKVHGWGKEEHCKVHHWKEEEHRRVQPNACPEKIERLPGALQTRDKRVCGQANSDTNNECQTSLWQFTR